MAAAGNFFEDFRIGQEFRHAPPRTLTEADGTLYAALYGSRFPMHCARTVAQGLGLPGSPLDDLLVFHVVFGKSVPDVSLNAVANLGYAGGVMGAPVFPGDTLSARSTVIGLKENSNRKTGVVWVKTVGVNQGGRVVAEYARWVMVKKRDEKSPAPAPHVPDLPAAVPTEKLVVPDGLDLSGYDTGCSGEARLWEDYKTGERIDHADGATVEEADHMMATRLYHNTARVHFNQHAEKDGRFGRRIVYGGHVISIARALSFNGLANAVRIAAINAGAHVAPVFAGDTIYAWSEVLEKIELPGRRDAGALRLRTIAAKDRTCADFPGRAGESPRASNNAPLSAHAGESPRASNNAPLSGRAGEGYDPAVVLDLDYTVLVPRPV